MSATTDNLAAVALAATVDALTRYHDSATCENPYNCGACRAVALGQRARMRLANHRRASYAVGTTLRVQGRLAEWFAGKK